jgi:uncharacterized protein (DUF433 family)
VRRRSFVRFRSAGGARRVALPRCIQQRARSWPLQDRSPRGIIENMETQTSSAALQTQPASVEHVEITPGICGGKPRIRGHRIKVQHVVVWHERMGMTADEIASQHPGLTLADVHAALAYYWDHRERIDADIAEGREFADKIRNGAPSIFDKVQQRNAQDNPLPPG